MALCRRPPIYNLVVPWNILVLSEIFNDRGNTADIITRRFPYRILSARVLKFTVVAQDGWAPSFKQSIGWLLGTKLTFL